MIRAGIIGLGVGEQHLITYREIGDCRVDAICDFDSEKLNEVSKRYPEIPLTTTDPIEILTNPNIDVISIASWDNFHAEQVLLALENNKHLFVEKPLCINESEAEAILQSLQSRPHLKLGTNLVLRLAPRFLFAKEMIERGKLGELISLEGDYNYGRLHKILSGWRGHQPGYSGILGGGIHIVDLLLWFHGRRVTHVSAFGGNIATKGSSFKNFDLVTGILHFDTGAVGKVSVNLGCVYPHFHRLSIYGTKGTFEHSIDGISLFHDFDRCEGDETKMYPRQSVDLPYPGVTKGVYLRDFLRSIFQDTPPPISYREIFNSLSVCFALERAAHSGTVETVNYFNGL